MNYATRKERVLARRSPNSRPPLRRNDGQYASTRPFAKNGSSSKMENLRYLPPGTTTVWLRGIREESQEFPEPQRAEVLVSLANEQKAEKRKQAPSGFFLLP